MNTTNKSTAKQRGHAHGHASMRGPLLLRRRDMIPVRFDWKRIVREIKAATSMSQDEIGAAVGCNQSAISLLEKGVTKEPLAGIGLRLLVLHDRSVTSEKTK